MTIALVLNVNDGIAIAADSATSFPVVDANGNVQGFSRVYNNANKIFNLHKKLPLGGVTWGLGSIGTATASRLMKDVRARFSGSVATHLDWVLDPNNYTVQQVADRVFEYIYNERYLPTFGGNPPLNMAMGFIIAGYSSGQESAELYQIQIDGQGACPGPQPPFDIPEQSGLFWQGQYEAVHRLIWGFDESLALVLQNNLGVPAVQIPGALAVIRGSLGRQLWTEAMPIQDAIDFVDFLADASADYSRFTEGAVTVGGPIELAAITKYEHFKWIRRKHYYSREFNPEGVA